MTRELLEQVNARLRRARAAGDPEFAAGLAAEATRLRRRLAELDAGSHGRPAPPDWNPRKIPPQPLDTERPPARLDA